MARGDLCSSLRRAIDCLGRAHAHHMPRTTLTSPAARRCLSTTPARPAEVTSEPPLEKFTAAPPIDFGAMKEQKAQREKEKEAAKEKDEKKKELLKRLRVIPASPSFFSAKPTFHDDWINLLALYRKVATLPTVTPAEAPKVAWKTVEQYRIMTNEPVKTQRYHKMLHLLRRLNCVHPTLVPEELSTALMRFKKANQPGDYVPAPATLDAAGRAKGVGRRKTSSAVVYMVEGEGEVLVNGKTLAEFFPRVHDRESAVWALKATTRVDKYNVFALVQGGGVTGQAEAMTLAVAKALLVHEPALKPALRRGTFTVVPIAAHTLPSAPSPGVVATPLAGWPLHTPGARACDHSIPFGSPTPAFPEQVLMSLAHSWLHHPRSQKGGEEEARPCQGTQDAYLGQALSVPLHVYYSVYSYAYTSTPSPVAHTYASHVWKKTGKIWGVTSSTRAGTHASQRVICAT